MEAEFLRFIEEMLKKNDSALEYNNYLINLLGPEGTRIHYVVENDCTYVYHHYPWMTSDMTIYYIGSEQESDDHESNADLKSDSMLPISAGNAHDQSLNMQSIIEKALYSIVSGEQCVSINKDYNMSFPKDFIIPKFWQDYINAAPPDLHILANLQTEESTGNNIYRSDQKFTIGPKVRNL